MADTVLIDAVGFLFCLILFSFISKRIKLPYVGLIIIPAAISLYTIGPEPFLFGIFLATGWHLLSVGVALIFPVDDL
ncbi:MAG: hypothetical protein QF365_06365 [Candidatus Thalassarchaeaceae archaeon]|nr:hypothetical protein [Candidatus Thalassarchaeaceae archaeon]MDP6317912.1 hypothetical protein [Candidatus Thalassarchaeaceae archaeon]HIH80013.1 hypothetical protein [Candidatus Thalassarchaeaceae archaeon]HJM29953.1 hypothetical protein [Candidatus Thalassarchaeaceae archaeon]HJN70758.1 hypothetical protein [Candidatus Thalassarchaeaceae archaeon]